MPDLVECDNCKKDVNPFVNRIAGDIKCPFCKEVITEDDDSFERGTSYSRVD